MSLISFQYLFFIIALAVVYYLIPGKLQKYALLIADYIFMYMCGGVKTVVFMLITSISVFAGARIIASRRENKNIGKLVFSVVFLMNIAFLICFKYINFFINSANQISGLFEGTQFDAITFIAPFGISFYTLTILGYLIDVFWEKYDPEKDFVKFMVFCSFFPQLTSGPITRYSEMEKEFSTIHRFDLKRAEYASQRILWGFFKKLVISERAATLVNTIYADYETYSGLYIIFGTMMFALQLYTDFSGCMDIVIGTAELLGIKLPENFTTPFYSETESEFWRRWHITLGAWFKDYLLYTLLKTELFIKIGDRAKALFGKKEGKKVPTYFGLFVLWFTVGFWHGGLWKYIVGSGLIHCFYMIISMIFEKRFKKVNEFFGFNTECFSFRMFRRVRTAILVCTGFMFFRADSFGIAIDMYRHIGTWNKNIIAVGGIVGLGLEYNDLIVLMFGILLLFLVSYLQQNVMVRDLIAKQNLPFRWICYISLFIFVIVYGQYGPGYNASSFIYQNF
ncbi:MAG: MBOAT family protein [Butyrivibrio sp.]|nr:MBOAT family protein [Butyrivibrio sp.]